MEIIVGLFVFAGAVGLLFLLIRQGDMKHELERVEGRLHRFALRLDRLEEHFQSAAPEREPVPSEVDVAEVEEKPISEVPRPEEGPTAPVADEVRWTAEPTPLVPPPLPAQSAPTATPATAPARDEVEDFEPAPGTPGIGERLAAWIKKLGPSDPNLTFEQAIWTFWLPRFGILLIATAVVFVLSLIAPKLGEGARVAIGYGIAGGLFGLGFWTDRRYPSYARAVFGGAFAMTYVVTFGTHYIEFSRIFESAWPSLGGLAAVVAGWIAWAQYRKSPAIALIATAVGQFTIALAIRTADNPGFYTVGGLVALGLGSAFFLWRNGWVATAFLGLVATYANHFYLLQNIEGDGTVVQFTTGMGILAAYFLTYAAAAWGFREESGPLWLRSAFVTLNSAGLFTLGSLFLNGFEFSEDAHHVFRYSAGGALLAIGAVYRRFRAEHRLHHVFVVKAVALATYGLSYQFSTDVLTACLALETVILLVSARRSQLPIMQCLGYGVGVLAFGHGLYTAIDLRDLAYTDAAYAEHAFRTGLTVLAFCMAAVLHERIRWNALWEDNTADSSLRIFNRPFPDSLRHGFAWVYAFAGVVLLELFGRRLIPIEDRALLLLAAAGGLAIAARFLRSPALGRGALVAVPIGIYWSARYALPTQTLGMDDPLFAETLPRAAVAVGIVLFLVEFVRRLSSLRFEESVDVFPALGFCGIEGPNPVLTANRPAGPSATVAGVVLALGAAGLVIPWIDTLVARGYAAPALIGAATAFWLAARALKSWPLSAAAFIPFAMGIVVGALEFTDGPPIASALPVLVLLALHYAATHPAITRGNVSWRLFESAWAAPLFAAGLTLLGGLYVTYELDPGWRSVALAAASLTGLAVALRFRPKTSACVAAVALLWGLALWHTDAYQILDTDWRLAAGAATMIAALGIERLGGVRIHRALHGAGTVAMWTLPMHLVAIEILPEWESFWWAVIAAGFLGYTAVTRRPETLLASVAALVVSSGTALIRDRIWTSVSWEVVVIAYAAPAALWLTYDRIAERLTEYVAARRIAAITVPIAAVLLTVLPLRIETLAAQYLTVSWSILGVALFVWAIVTRRTLHRYTSLAVLALAVGRVVLIDTADLEALYRVGAFMAVGLALLGLGLVYIKVFGVGAGTVSQSETKEVSDYEPVDEA